MGPHGWWVGPDRRAAKQIQALIRGSDARMGHKRAAFMAAYCLSVSNYGDYSFGPLPALLHSPRALNKLHFTNGKLSIHPGSGVYKYVKYTFNYFK